MGEKSAVSLKKLRTRIKAYTFEKGLLNKCNEVIKKISSDIKTTCLPKKKLIQTVQRNVHGKGYTVYNKFKKYIYPGYIILPDMSKLSRVMEVFSNKKVIVDARIT